MENYPIKCFKTKEKETQIKVLPWISANRPSNNWAQNSRFHKQKVLGFRNLDSLTLSQGTRI